MRQLFADTSFFIALLLPNDAGHRRAAELSRQRNQLTTTAWVLCEVGAAFAAPHNRRVFVDLLESVRRDRCFRFVASTQDLFDRGPELYADRPDKAWSLVDCISFVVMRERGLTDALTADRHFEQAGFRALMAEAEA